MATMLITPAVLRGSVTIPASKSMCHRAVICAALAQGTSQLFDATMSDDIHATIEGMRALGADICVDGNRLTITGTGGIHVRHSTIACGESGSTLRFLIPLALLAAETVTFTGRGRLAVRPLAEYEALCQEQGLVWGSDGGLPVTVCGQLQPGQFSLRGNVSSQFLSGLLFALPLLAGDSTISMTTPLESRGYVDLTLAALAEFGVLATHRNYQEFHIPGRQSYKPRQYSVEGDFSQAAFWLVAGTIGAEVSCLGLAEQSMQGDKVIAALLKKAGGAVRFTDTRLTAAPSLTRGTIIDAADCPDLVPVLAVLACLSQGETRIIQAGRLRFKESDRLAAITRELTKLGGNIREDGDSLVIDGKAELSGGEVDSWQDHRIAMALAVASVRCRYPVTIHGAECVNKSYPNFWRDFASLGGVIHGGDLG